MRTPDQIGTGSGARHADVRRGGTNPPEVIEAFDQTFASFPDAGVTREAHLDFKKRVPGAIGLIRTGDPTAYGNVIVESV